MNSSSSDRRDSPAGVPSPVRRRSISSMESWLGHHRTMVAAVVLTLACAVRALHLADAWTGYQADLHRWDQSDMRFFDEWASRIAEGDWLTDVSLHPLHEWHVELAREHFARRPGDPAAPPARASQEQLNEAARALWDRWYGGKRFHQEPAYPYALALTRVLLSPDVRIVFAWQSLLGALSCLLVLAVGRAAFGEIEGALAALLAALSPVALHHETTLLRTAPTTFMALLFAWLLYRARGSGRMGKWLVVGLTAGLSMTLQASLILLLPAALFVVALDAWERKAPASQRLRSALLPAIAVSLAWAACLVPVAARNIAVGQEPLALSSVGAITFVRVNAADVPPSSPGLLSSHAARIMGDAEGAMRPAMRLTLATHGSVGNWLGHVGAKVEQLWHYHERSNNTNFYFERQGSPLLRALPVTFRITAPLSIVGLVLALLRPRRALPLLLTCAVLVVPLLAFHVLSRYRAPLVTLLLPFAALTLVAIARAVEARKWIAAAPLALGVLLAAAWTSRPQPLPRPLVATSDLALAYVVHHERVVEEARSRGDFAAEADAWADLLAHAPPVMSELSPERLAMGEEERSLARLGAQFEAQRAKALRAAGRAAEAEAATARATRLAASLRAAR